MSWSAPPLAGLNAPAFLLTFAVIQAGVLLVVIRGLDVYGRQPLGMVALVAVWGATGAVALSFAGNEFVKGQLYGDVRLIFGDAISAPLVEETAKGLALLAAIGPVRSLLRRAGISLFDGPLAGVVYGAAIGVGFGFTEDLYFLVAEARSAGIDAGFETYLYRRDFLGPAILHHAAFTAALGAGLGLATRATGRARKVALATGGFVLAVFMHAVNNGLVELVLVLKFGVAETARWTVDSAQVPAVTGTVESIRRLMGVIELYYLATLGGLIVFWNYRQRRVIADELDEEAEHGLVKPADLDPMLNVGRRSRADWDLLRTGQIEQLRHQRRLRRQIAQLGLLKSQSRRLGRDDATRINRARREIATLSTFDVVEHRLPTPPSRFVGRERELREIAEILLHRGTRIATLVGPGGVGKTRLSIEFASLHRDRFASGVFFVELASLTDPDLVPQAIADALELIVQPDDSAVTVLGKHLRDKHLLLVLDSFEHVTAAAAAIGEILATAERVNVLATSREPLRISGEHEFAVEPLELPDPDAPAGNAAVALFVDRAGAVDPGFELTDGNAAAVAEICIGLDGLPLAIELAAARAKVLTPEAMLDRLGGHLPILSQGARDLPARHQTLSSAIDWSYELLSGSEQALFKRLGVFVDGASIEAVEAVCVDGERSQALDDLGSLRDKSLIRRCIGAGGQPRFAMLTTIREYALERLRADGELAEMRERHARYFAGLAENAEPQLVGPDQAEWFERLDDEVGNLRAVLQWSAEAGRDDLGLRVAGALPRFWAMRGLRDPSCWLSEAVARNANVSASVLAKALFAEGYAALDHGDFARAEASFEASLAAYRKLDEPHGTAASLAQLAFLQVSSDDPARATRLAEESVEIARRTGDANVESVALGALAENAACAGDYERASELYEQSLALRRKLGDRRNIANALLNLGRVALAGGERERARALLEQGLALAREVADTWSVSVGLASLGRLALREGRTAEGSDLLGKALALAAQRGGKRLVLECVSALAEAASETAPDRSARLLGAAEALRRDFGISPSPIEGPAPEVPIAAMRQVLGEASFAAQWHAGLALDLDGVVALALSDPTAPTAGEPTNAATRVT